MSRRMSLAENLAQMTEKRNTYRVLVSKPEGKRPFGIPKLSWEDNIIMDLREMGWVVTDLIHLG
jgi:hypothetical protein